MKPNWELWLAKGTWTLNQAVDLMLGHEPGTVPDALSREREQRIREAKLAMMRGELPSAHVDN